MSTVLIVDDDASTRVVLRPVLETAGFGVPFNAVELADCVRALVSNIGAMRPDALAS